MKVRVANEQSIYAGLEGEILDAYKAQDLDVVDVRLTSEGGPERIESFMSCEVESLERKGLLPLAVFLAIVYGAVAIALYALLVL